MLSIIYAAPADLRSPAAHNVHIFRMCEALAGEGIALRLIVRDAPDREVLQREFSSSQGFEILRTRTVKGFLGSAKFALAVLRASRRGDVIVTRNLPVAVLTSRLNRRVFLELHSPVLTRRAAAMFDVLLKARGFGGLVVITDALKKDFCRRFRALRAECVHVLPDGANPISHRPSTAIELQRPAIGYVGGFMPGKGIEMVLRVAEQLPAANFYLVGSADRLGTAQAALGANVKLVPRVSHAEALRWIEAFDIAVLPNQHKVLVDGGGVDIGQWTSPLKLFEYMAAGKPIVASRIEVLQEVLEEHRNCLLADPEDPREWAEQIRSLIDDPAKGHALGRQAKEDFEAGYTWSARAKKLSDLMRREI